MAGLCEGGNEPPGSLKVSNYPFSPQRSALFTRHIWNHLHFRRLIRFSRLRHLERMPEGRLPKRALYGHPGGLRKRGRPRLRWLQDVEDDLRRVGCKRWRQRAQDRDEWFLLIKEAQALHGL
ncbi:hypothetical protein ANN_21893 [Periplaneta americana]|uniref:Uncharacterized protein n=1 Tax=Periplaneta americana TaxID=6978 RepID=A0ABQ8S702_PERAM|nr:hypothetical protein ANN_21893 [Periplaneta americana]